MIKTVAELPPNYEAICRHFDIKNRPNIVFAYGDKVYVPSGQPLADHLEVHEATHLRQQKEAGPAKWWQKYLEDAEFRLAMEVEAYRAQYQFLLEHYIRQQRRHLLRQITRDLAGPIYGKMVTEAQARELITGEAA